MPELVSLTLGLKPLADDGGGTEPSWWGRAAQALLLRVVAGRDQALANALHEGESGVRPFTVSSLMGHFAQGRVAPGEVYTLRLSAFRADVASLLAEEAQSGALQAGQVLELDYQKFEVLAPQEGRTNPWAASTSYQALGAPYLLAQEQAPRRISLQLNSPTTFKSGGLHVPLPTPGLVFGSLLERWNAWSPLAFPGELRRYAEECLAVSQYALRSKPIPQKQNGLRVGAVGKMTFTAAHYDRYWMSLVATLADFALFAGVGAGSAQGLGQVRRVVEG